MGPMAFVCPSVLASLLLAFTPSLVSVCWRPPRPACWDPLYWDLYILPLEGSCELIDVSEDDLPRLLSGSL